MFAESVHFRLPGTSELRRFLKWFENNDVTQVADLIGAGDLTEWPGAPEQRVDDLLLANSLVEVSCACVKYFLHACVVFSPSYVRPETKAEDRGGPY